MPATDVLYLSISSKRDSVQTYLSAAVARRDRLLRLTLVSGALAAAMTVAPALGGKPLATWLTVTLGLSSPAWQLLCGAAAICSLTATIATQLMKSHHLDENIAKAQAVRARLEMLEVATGVGQVSEAEAAEELMKCIQSFTP
jgi:MFS family permease